MSDRLTIACLTEGTYPYNRGGVSTWSDLLLSGLSGVDFHVLAATSQPYARPRYPLPPNAASLTQIPLWGASPDAGLRGSLRITTAQIKHEFVPAFRTWVRCVLRAPPDTGDPTPVWDGCGHALLVMAAFLRRHGYAQTFRSEPVWTAYTEEVGRWARAQGHVATQPAPTLQDQVVTLGWMAALLRPLAVAPPEAHLFHATVAASVSLIGIVTHLERGTPLLLTEHGIYLRERAISASSDPTLSYFQRHFLVRMADLVERLCYHFAAVIAPVCAFNGQWEQALGADPAKIRPIYNAVDTNRFRPAPKHDADVQPPTVVVVANVTPIKDILTLIRAADRVRQQVANARFLVYGSLTADADYARRCQSLISELSLEGTVRLQGHHPRPEEVYPQGDLTVLCSISEAFPFTVLESMACGRPVVGTDVGGVAEALGDAGLLVPPRAPEALGWAISALLTDTIRCQELGRRARQRALQHYGIEKLLRSYLALYQELAPLATITEPQRVLPVTGERMWALNASGHLGP